MPFEIHTSINTDDGTIKLQKKRTIQLMINS
jgi:hypothetical protein